MHLYQITRTAVDKICRPVINSFDMEEWMHLLLSLFADKKEQEERNVNFPKRSNVLSYIDAEVYFYLFLCFKKDNMQIEKMLLDKLEAAT